MAAEAQHGHFKQSNVSGSRFTYKLRRVTRTESYLLYRTHTNGAIASVTARVIIWSSAYRVLVIIFENVRSITNTAVPTKKNDTAMMTRVDWDSFDRPQTAAVDRAMSAAIL